MSISSMFFFAFIILCTVIIIALSPRSKACKFDTKFNFKGFDFKFETNEKSTPSDQV